MPMWPVAGESLAMSFDFAMTLPLVLVVDPNVASRHFLWRVLSRAFGVVEAGSGLAARQWIDQRPDLGALIVQEDLPDERGLELVRTLASAKNPIASRAILLARPGPDHGDGSDLGPTMLHPEDVRAILCKLGTWLLPPDAAPARDLQRDVERLG